MNAKEMVHAWGELRKILRKRPADITDGDMRTIKRLESECPTIPMAERRGIDELRHRCGNSERVT
jgi:hypothetical protein